MTVSVDGGEVIMIDAIDVRILDMRATGMSYREIARVLNASDIEISYSGVRRRYLRALSETCPDEDRDSMRKAENHLLDRLQREMFTDLTAERNRADSDLRQKIVGRMTLLSRRRALMNGLDEPTRVDVDVSVERRELSDVDAQIVRLAREMRQVEAVQVERTEPDNEPEGVSDE